MENNMKLSQLSEEGLEYNTQRNNIILSQYGRNIHKLIEYAMTIEKKEDRNAAALQIIEAMEILNPKVKYMENYKKVLWNHLAIMSNFKLDIDYPYDIIKEDEIKSKPEKIPVIKTPIKKRQYGRIIEEMIKIAINTEDKEMQKELVEAILLQMKRIYIDWNKDIVNDQVLFDDLLKLSDNKLSIPEGFKLPQTYEIRNKQRGNIINSKNTSNSKRYRKRN
jgi:hypothetical protein